MNKDQTVLRANVSTVPAQTLPQAGRLGYELGLAWRNLTAQPVQTLITILVVALAIALFIVVVALNAGVQRGIIIASDPFGMMIIGPKGSAQELVLNTILLQGLPLGTMPLSVYEDMVDSERVSLAVPLAMGDNVGGARIIGTNRNFFELRPSLPEPPTFQLAQGRLFEAEFEAVLGSRAAAELGLGLGDQFFPEHGVEQGLESEAHTEHRYTVVGILQPTSSPYDTTIITTMESVWEIHAEAAEIQQLSPLADGQPHGPELTAVLVRPAGFVEANYIWRGFRQSAAAQAVFPGGELGGLFDLLNQGQQVLTVVGYVAAVMAMLTMLLALYSTIDRRGQMIAVMRSLGAGRGSIFRMVLSEALIVAVVGALLGRLLGYGTAAAIAANLAQQAAIPIPISYQIGLEPGLWLLTLGVGLLAGVIPAVIAYRVKVVERLFGQ